MPLRLPANRMPHFFEFLRTALTGLLILLIPTLAYADDDCAYEAIGKVADTIALASPADFHLTPNGKVQTALEKVQADEHALSCVRFLQRDTNFERRNKGYEEQWSLIADDSNLSNRALFDKCNSLAACKTSQAIVDLLSRFCSNQQKDSGMAINIAPGDCAKIKKTPWPLSPARRGIGWGLVAAGGVTMILGAIQMGVPLFSTDDGCVVAGLRHPCSADRFGVGGALLGSGLAVLGGGLLTLTLPARGN